MRVIVLLTTRQFAINVVQVDLTIYQVTVKIQSNASIVVLIIFLDPMNVKFGRKKKK